MAILGNLENRRVTEFCKHVHSKDRVDLSLVSWKDLLTDPGRWLNVLRQNDWIRIESPGEDLKVQAMLSALGSPADPPPKPLNFGEIGQLDSTYRGFCIALGWMQDLNVSFFNHPADIAVMFDKWDSHQVFQDRLTSRVVGPADFPESKLSSLARGGHSFRFRPRTMVAAETLSDFFEQLEDQDRTFTRFFLKPRFSSSASGVCAIHRFGDRIRLLAPIQLESKGGTTRIFNSLKVQCFTDLNQINSILSILLPQRMIVEDWIPKARWQGLVFDFRVLVIGGRARHTVVRGSNRPMTNLHLGNHRIPFDQVLEFVGKDVIEQVKKVAEAAANCFPRSHSAGVDVILSSSKKIYVCEINAFGDLLPGVIDAGESAYEAIWNSWIRKNQLGHQNNDDHRH